MNQLTSKHITYVEATLDQLSKRGLVGEAILSDAYNAIARVAQYTATAMGTAVTERILETILKNVTDQSDILDAMHDALKMRIDLCNGLEKL